MVAALVLAPHAVGAQTGPPDARVTPVPGNGVIDVKGFVRVIDGDTIDTWINGRRVGIGILGIDAPMGNTECGRRAKNRLRELTRGGVRLTQDSTILFDARGRRMFSAHTLTGELIAEQLARSGLARANGAGADAALVRAAEAQARSAGAGCVWQGSADDPAVALFGVAVRALTFVLAPLRPGAAGAAPQRAPARQSGQGGPAGTGSVFLQETVVGGLNEPVAFAPLPDGRILVAEKPGVVRLVKDGAVLPTPFIDIRDRVNDYWDRGLLGIAADTDFATNGYVYLLYVYENDPLQYNGTKTSRLTRVTATGDTASPASEVVLVGTVTGASCKLFPAGADCLPADAPSHAVGNVKAAADGTVFVTSGDAGPFNYSDDSSLRALDVDQLAGKLLRVTRDGKGVAGNPFWNGDASANRSKVWAYGLRNPYRFSIEPSSGIPYLGDVGDGLYEEINVALPGSNFGWPCYEGTQRHGAFQARPTCQALYAQGPAAVRGALVAYPHTTSEAVTGGVFYTGTLYPAELQGAYIYGDYVKSWMRSIRVSPDHTLEAGPNEFVGGAGAPVDIGMGSDGNIYYVAFLGELRRIRYAPPPPAPDATSYVSDLTWTSMSNGFGPVERDASNGEQAAGDGRPIRIGGSQFAKGLGAHAPSDVRYHLGRSCAALRAYVGVDDEVGSSGTVWFEVWGDGTLLTRTGVLRGTDVALPLDVDVTGVNELRLVVGDGGDGTVSDHADWADAQVTCSSDATPPTVVARSPEDGAANVAPSVSVSATFSEALDAATVSTSTFILAPVGGSGVDAAVSYDSATRVAGLKPLAELAPSTTYVVTLRGGTGGVTDAAGNPLAQDVSWRFGTTANRSPKAAITAPAPSYQYRVGDVISYSGTATDPEDGSVPPERLSWRVLLHHCPAECHAHPFTAGSGMGGSFTVPDHGDQSSFEVILTATDSGGLTNQTSVLIRPRTSRVTLSTSPVGLQVGYDGVYAAAPLTFTSVVGSSHLVDAPSPQGGWAFQGWSDGLPQAHSITVGESDASLTASYGTAGTVYVSDLAWASATNGWGPVERDRSNGETAAGDGRALSLRGVTYAKGLGVHARSDVRFDLAGACSRFTADIGVDDEAGTEGSVVFQVWGDGLKLFESGLLTRSSAPAKVSTSVTGVRQLALVVTDGGNGNVSDHADWAGAQLECDAVSPTATPTTTPATSPLASTYLSDLAWASATNGWGPVERDRSNGETAAGDGRALSLRGQSYSKGLGVHARSDVRFDVRGQCSSVIADVGVDDEAGPEGSVVFQVWSAGTLLFESPLLGRQSAAYPIAVALGGASTFSLVVTDGGNGNVSDHADWAGARVLCAEAATPATPTPTPTPSRTPTASATNTPTAAAGGTTVYVSDLAWASATNGWGPVERDRSNGETAAGDGRALSLRGVTYAKGLGVHARSDVRFDLAGACSAFYSDVGVDDEAGPEGSVTFEVWAAGARVYESGPLTRNSGIASVAASVAGASELRLVVTDGGNGNVSDHADWAGARLQCDHDPAAAGPAASATPTRTPTPVPAGATPSVAVSATLTTTPTALPTSGAVQPTATPTGTPSVTPTLTPTAARTTTATTTATRSPTVTPPPTATSRARGNA